MSNDHHAASRRTFLTASAAGTIAATGALGAHVALAAVSEPDPVFAALAHERELDAAWMAIQDQFLDGRKDLKGALDAAIAAHGEEQRRVMAIRPTTDAGFVALIDRFEEITEGLMIDNDVEGLAPLLASIRAHFVGRA